MKIAMWRETGRNMERGNNLFRLHKFAAPFGKNCGFFIGRGVT
jgi:hypothetical protein